MFQTDTCTWCVHCAVQTRVSVLCSTDMCTCCVRYRYVYLVCALQICVPGVCSTNTCSIVNGMLQTGTCILCVQYRQVYLMCMCSTGKCTWYVQYTVGTCNWCLQYIYNLYMYLVCAVHIHAPGVYSCSTGMCTWFVQYSCSGWHIILCKL